MTRPLRSAQLAALALGLAALPACGSGRYVWIDDVPAPHATEEYVIASGDLVSVRVFNQENMSTRAKVRSDGKIAVPLVGDVEVRGKAPATVSKELAAKLKEYVVSPTVTVTVEETQPTAVSVLGEVAHPGNYTLDASAGLLQAVAAAGGLTEYANRDGIYLVRYGTTSPRIRFTFSALSQGEGRAATFHLRAGDVVVVE